MSSCACITNSVVAGVAFASATIGYFTFRHQMRNTQEREVESGFLRNGSMETRVMGESAFARASRVLEKDGVSSCACSYLLPSTECDAPSQ